MIIEKDSIVGMRTEDGSIVCSEHMTNEQWNNMKSEQIILRDDLEKDPDKIYFCDECDEQL